MAVKYNPQIFLEFFKLGETGEELGMDVELIGDISNTRANKPPLIECSINKTLGSTQQTASISLHNAPIIEELRGNYFGFLESIRGQNWRVYIYAWWGEAENLGAPVFVGDIYDEFTVTPSSANDSVLTLNAKGHDVLMHSKPWKKVLEAEITYREAIEQVFAYFVELGYNDRFIIQDEDLELDALIERPYSISGNPTNFLNDTCRHFDFYWGIDTKTPYFLKRDEIFTAEQLPEEFETQVATVEQERGAISLLNFSKYHYEQSALWDNEITLGKQTIAGEFGQINTGFGDAVVGRVDSMSISLSNRVAHTCNLRCSYFGSDFRVVLPPQREDYSGRA